MLGLKDALLVKANAGRTALMNVRDYVEVRVKEDAKAGVLAVAISVLLGVLNHALMAAMGGVKEIVVGTVPMSAALAVGIVVVVVAVIIVIVQLIIMIKKNKPGLLMSPGLSFLFKLQEGFKE